MLNTADEVSLEFSSADLKARTILDAFISLTLALNGYTDKSNSNKALGKILQLI